jgi:hypothetical protein
MFEIYFVLERFTHIRVKELRHTAYIYMGRGRLMYPTIKINTIYFSSSFCPSFLLFVPFID